MNTHRGYMRNGGMATAVWRDKRPPPSTSHRPGRPGRARLTIAKVKAASAGPDLEFAVVLERTCRRLRDDPVAAPWLPINTTVTSAIPPVEPAPARVSTRGVHLLADAPALLRRRHRRCDTLDADFSGVDWTLEHSTFRGHVVLTKTGGSGSRLSPFGFFDGLQPTTGSLCS